MSDQKENDGGLFKKIGDILNAPLPGTDSPESKPSNDDPEEENSLLEYVRDILNAPLPGTEPQQEPTEAQPTTEARPEKET